MNKLIVGFLIFFIALMFTVGIVMSKKVKDLEDYFLGGRKTPIFLIISTLLASEVGGGVMLGSVGYGYSMGWGALWYLAPMAIGLILFGTFMAERLNRDGSETRCVSMFEWLAGRFDNAKDIRFLGAAVMLTGSVGSLAAQFVAMGTAVSSILDVDQRLALLVGGVVIIIYASLGGLLSVMWTDLLQAGVFAFGMVIFLPLLISQPEIGGFSALFSHINCSYAGVFQAGTFDWRLGMVITMTVAPFVRQYYYQRMFAAKSPKGAKTSIFAQAVILILIAVWTVLVGAGIHMLSPSLENSETAMPWALGEIFSPVVAAIILSAIVACIMSTADTFVNAASLTFVKDILGIISKDAIDGKRELRVARLSSFVIGALALMIGLGSTSIMVAIQKAWAILGGGLFCPMVISYFWKRSSRKGVLWSMIAGCVITLTITLFTKINAVFIGIPASLITLVVVSLALPDKENR